MHLSTRVREISESVTLKLNARAVEMAESGKQIYNLTAGQLPFRPSSDFINLIRSELDFIKSYHYSPVPGFTDLRKKIIAYHEVSRGVKFAESGVDFDCVVSNGGKHALANILGSLIESGDEVIILAPYWVSYPEMVKFCKGVPHIVKTTSYDLFVPSIDDIKRAISPKTKAIIVNSPQNPTGLHYTDKWMSEFGELMLDYPEIAIISDEIYYELFYFDPRPTYFYQEYPQLIKQTIIVDGISKTLASTGLRIGWTIAPKELTNAVSKLQGQTTSGANSLIQRALANFDFSQVPVYLEPVKKHLRENADILKDAYRENNMGHLWYQSLSAFYYLLDFSQTRCINRYQKNENDKEDYSFQICEDLLINHGVAAVPGGAFGVPNTARISLVLEKDPFTEAVKRLLAFMADG